MFVTGNSDVNWPRGLGAITFLFGRAGKEGTERDVELLMAKTGAEFVSNADSDGDYPLTMAIQREVYRVVKALLKHPSIDMEKKDSSGKTAFFSYSVY